MTPDTILNRILGTYKIPPDNLIGKGSESYVYTYKNDQAFKIYLKANVAQLSKLRLLYQKLNSQGFSFKFPLIKDIIIEDDAVITIERLLPGISPENLIKQKKELTSKVLSSMFNIISQFEHIDFSDSQYGDVLGNSNITNSSWNRFLIEKAKQRILVSETYLNADIFNFSSVFQEWCNATRHLLNPIRNFVHGDYYFSNVLVDIHGYVTSVLDVSPMSICGDHILDIVGFLSYLELSGVIEKSDADGIKAKVYAKYSKELHAKYGIYRMYLSIYLSDSCLFDKKLYEWCLRGLREYADTLNHTECIW